MNPVASFDTEIEPNNGKVLNNGSVKGNGALFHTSSVADFIKFIDGWCIQAHK